MGLAPADIARAPSAPQAALRCKPTISPRTKVAPMPPVPFALRCIAAAGSKHGRGRGDGRAHAYSDRAAIMLHHTIIERTRPGLYASSPDPTPITHHLYGMGQHRSERAAKGAAVRKTGEARLARTAAPRAGMAHLRPRNAMLSMSSEAFSPGGLLKPLLILANQIKKSTLEDPFWRIAWATGRGRVSPVRVRGFSRARRSPFARSRRWNCACRVAGEHGPLCGAERSTSRVELS